MALDNKISNIGDSLIVSVVLKYTGVVTLSDYTEDVNGLTAARTADRRFRYSLDNILWSEWQPLNSTYLSQVTEIALGVMYIEVEYTRTGTETSGEIEFLGIELSATCERIDTLSPAAANTIFKNIIDRESTRETSLNLFKKLYFRGILPGYITRGDNGSLEEDREFATLFSTVSDFFAMFLEYFKDFGNINDNPDVLREYLRSNGIIFNDKDVTVEELQYLVQNSIQEIRKRGTSLTLRRSGDVLPDGSTVPVNGELIRLLNSKTPDEFLSEIVPKENLGWNIGNSSPMYRGTCETAGINKTPESTEELVDITKFPTFGNVTNNSGAFRVTIPFTASVGSTAGIGRPNTLTDIRQFLIPVDHELDYEIVFDLNYDYYGLGNFWGLEFSIEGFDISKNKISEAFLGSNSGSPNSSFFSLELGENVDGMRIRGAIHAYRSDFNSDYSDNTGHGSGLIFNNPLVKYIYPTIKFSKDDANIGTTLIADIYNFKIRPMVRGKNILPKIGENEGVCHSLCFTGLSNVFYIYARNKNVSMTTKEIEDFANRYLLSYNSVNIFQLLNNY